MSDLILMETHNLEQQIFMANMLVQARNYVNMIEQDARTNRLIMLEYMAQTALENLSLAIDILGLDRDQPVPDRAELEQRVRRNLDRGLDRGATADDDDNPVLREARLDRTFKPPHARRPNRAVKLDFAKAAKIRQEWARCGEAVSVFGPTAIHRALAVRWRVSESAIRDIVCDQAWIEKENTE